MMTRSQVMIYDRQKWDDLAVAATFDEPNQHDIHVLDLIRHPGAPNVADGAFRLSGWLTLIVDGLNDLHRGTSMLVRGWTQ